MNNKQKVLIIGAGPAGLTAAYLLSQKKFDVTVIEQDQDYVGGLSKTVEYNGYKFDIGGHRFYTKSERVNNFWKEVLPNDFLEKKRSSRIYYKQKYFSYPLKISDTLTKLPITTSIDFMLSYIFRSKKNSKANLEEWLISQFGKKLYLAFFKSYTENVWGVKCKDMDYSWGPQRIKGLSISSVIKDAIQEKCKTKEEGAVKSLITKFIYPTLGPGMFWKECAKLSIIQGCNILMGQTFQSAKRIQHENKWELHYIDNIENRVTVEKFDYIVSSIALNELIRKTDDSSLLPIKHLAEKLTYRDFITVALILNKKDLNTDQWIYIQDEGVRVARIQNYSNWSEQLVPNKLHSCIGMEYFCTAGDDLWQFSDEELIELGAKELVKLNLIADKALLLDAKVVRVTNAYPIYHHGYEDDLEQIRKVMSNSLPNFFTVGRNGLHRYNNQDHSIMTAMLVAENIISGTTKNDPWKVNQEADYVEG